jgi:hypothetical protein
MSAPLLLAAPQAAGYVIGVGRTVPTAAALLALVGVVVGGLHGANAAGGLGTGNGLAGAVIAVVLGLIGVVLGWLALAAARRTAGRR